MNIITDTKAKSNFSWLKTNGVKFDNMLHETGLYAINQVNLHGNTNAANKLLGLMNKSARKEAFIVWFRDHAKVILNKAKLLEYKKDRKLYDTRLGKTGEITIEQALENANSKRFYDYTKESKPISSYDVLSRLESLLKSANEFKGEVKHKELIANLTMLAKSVKDQEAVEIVKAKTTVKA